MKRSFTYVCTCRDIVEWSFDFPRFQKFETQVNPFNVFNREEDSKLCKREEDFFLQGAERKCGGSGRPGVNLTSIGSYSEQVYI